MTRAVTRRRPRMSGVALAVVAALGILSGLAMAGTVTGLSIAKRTVKGKSEVIVIDNRGVTVYELGGESLAKLECVMPACFKVWQPLKVPSATTKLKVGKLVPGNVSIMHRVKGRFYQVMLDRHPLYYYSGDKGRKGMTTGQGITSFGGTWHVVGNG